MLDLVGWECVLKLERDLEWEAFAGWSGWLLLKISRIRGIEQQFIESRPSVVTIHTIRLTLFKLVKRAPILVNSV